MPAAILYLLKLSVSLAIVWAFYQLLLRRLTFYDLNRWYLLGYSVLSFFIPLIDVGAAMEKGDSVKPLLIHYIPSIGDYGGLAVSRPAGISGWTVLLIVMGVGSAFFIARLTIRWLSLRAVRRGAVLLQTDGVKIYQLKGAVRPFSFGNAIYINPGQHTEKEWSEIILHEYVHIRQQHSMDILFAELLCIVNWYNPFVWLIRHSIRQNLEFIADRTVLRSGVDKKGYQYHLLKVVGEPAYRLATNFNFSSLKKRIIMMNKIRSARLHLIKFLFILPLIGVLLVAFRSRMDRLWEGQVYVNTVGITAEAISGVPLAGVKVHEKYSGLEAVSDERGYYRLRIPVVHDSLRIRIETKKEGYADSRRESYFPSVPSTQGMIVTSMLYPSEPKAGEHGIFMEVPWMGKAPVDPGYTDAVDALKEMMQANADVNRSVGMKQQHPEVALFYTTEDKKHQVVFRKDGSLEKYGYGDGPSVEDMEKKYGALPVMMKQGHTAGSGYLSQWERIAEQAQRDFHTTDPSVREVFFPGDSRVIVVLKSGAANLYDMDSNDPKERAMFERSYGKLPDCVPPVSGGSIVEGKPYTLMLTSRMVAADTGRPGSTAEVLLLRDTAKKGMGKDTLLRRRFRDTLPGGRAIGMVVIDRRLAKDTAKPIGANVRYVVDGEMKPAGYLQDSIAPETIYAIDVIKGEKALQLYGENGKYGVVTIMTKAFREKFPPGTAGGYLTRKAEPLFIVDGVEYPKADGLKDINPDQIESIEVLKDEQATIKYGDKGRNGVVLVHLKKKTV